MLGRAILVGGLLFSVAGRISAEQLPTFSAGSPVAAVESIEREGSAVSLIARLESREPAYFRIDVLADHMVRIRANRDGGFATTLPERDGFLKSDWPGADFNLIDDENHTRIEAPLVSLQIDKRPFHFSFYQGEKLLTRLSPEDGLSFNDEQARLTMASPEDEHFFGFGDQGSGWRPLYPPDRAPLDHRGKSLLMAGLSSGRQYYTPFFMSSRGYGLLINTLVKSFWDMAKRHKDRYSIEIDEPRLDVYLVAGPSFKDILKRYTELAGRAPLMPKWVLGGQVHPRNIGILMDGRIPSGGWKTHWYDQNQIEHVARTTREQHTPADLLTGANSWWTIRTSFEFPAQIPHPKKMIDYLRSLNFHVELWQRPTIVEGDYAVYREAERKGYLVKGPDSKPFVCPSKYGGPSAMVDLTNPEAVQWWQKLTREKTELGVSMWFLDSASSSFIEAYPEALELQFHNGMTGKELDNYYGPIYLKAIWDVLKDTLNGRRAVVSCRHQAYFATGRYPYMELGDRGRQSPQEARIRYALNAGLSGIPFWNGADFGCLGLPLLDIEQKIRLIPLTYTYWRKAHETGLPIMRAMVLEYPEDPESYEADTQFLYGEEFLVAPVLKEGEQWRLVYLPEGEWVDYWTGEKHLGPEWKYIHVGREPREEVDITGFTWTPVTRGAAPVLVRGGSIIPVGPLMEWIGQKPTDPLTLDIYPNGESSFSLYEDDGETYAYESGAYTTTEFQCREDERGVTVEIGAAKGNYDGKLSQRNYILQIHGTMKPVSVKMGGRVLPGQTSEEKWQKADRGWWYKRGNNQIGDRTVYVRLPTVRTDVGVNIRLEGAIPTRYYR